MMYEAKVNELAEEFGVHRNTIRNWINSGTLPAQKGPGRRYLIQLEAYRKLCEKYGRTPRIDGIRPSSPPPPAARPPQEQTTLQVVRLTEKTNSLYPESTMVETCTTCGSCASACPLSGVDGLDPRKIIRMAFLGLNEELLAIDWPWKCTLCGRCEESCSMDVRIVDLIRTLRAARERTKVPHPLQKGITLCLEKGNNLGIPKTDFTKLLNTLGEELHQGACRGFVTPIDVRGARLLITVNSRDPFAEPERLTWWWRIFHAAQESWTIASENWEGVNWAYYTGDDNAMKTMVARIVDNMKRLNCQALLLPECGHAYYATRLGLQRWFPEALKTYTVYSVFDLLMEYICGKRIILDNSVHNQLTAIHDPCHYGRQSRKAFGQSFYRESRAITQACCPNMTELEPTMDDTYCCGAGGGANAGPFTVERVYYGRKKARQIKESKAQLIVTSCHNCKDQMEQTLNREFDLGIEVKLLWELVAQALHQRPDQS
ncbi:MAG: Fe-S oxidoreductase [Desulfobulbus propionicus]|nr:MAG: Fe-S oxidoreductase [Desulfobulbus propionicus]